MKKNMGSPAILVFLILVPLFCADVSGSTKHHPKHFVLVHGAGLGAWSWYKLVPPLRSYGHNVTAIDLAASGINLSRVNELRSFSDYSKPLMDCMDSIPSTGRVILVGHSLGGAAISQAMELFPEKISVAVFVTAAMPGPSLPFSVIAQKDAALATMLLRPLPLTNAKELVFSEAKYGSVNRVFVISEKDQIWTKQFQEWMIKENPPNQVELIRGSDHMVMISEPSQLWACLLGIAHDRS